MTGKARNRRVIVTGAQTGGHLYPAVALGRWLADRDIDVVMVASGESAEADVLKGVSFPVEILRVGKLNGMGWMKRLKGAASLPSGLARAAALVRKIDAGMVVGFGGYTTGPVVLAAAMMGVPTAICEENSIPGLTNRLLARVAGRIFVAYAEAGTRLSSSKSLLTGVPVRPSILEVPAKVRTQSERRVLVFGGSQGSRFLNRRMPGVLKTVAGAPGGVQIMHQAGRNNGAEVRALYAELGLSAEVKDYIDDMSAAYAWADFVVARSGAGTVSEISAIGLPALFVPFAAATDDHQTGNARPLVDAGGALMTSEDDFDSDAVARFVAEILGSPERLDAMAIASRTKGRRDALDVMGAEVMSMLAGGGR